MGDTFFLGPDDVVALVDPSQEHATEVDGPDTVVDLLEADGVLLEGVGDEQQPLLQTDGTGVGDPLDDEVSGILNGRQGPGVGAAGGTVERGWRPVLQRLLRDPAAR